MKLLLSFLLLLSMTAFGQQPSKAGFEPGKSGNNTVQSGVFEFSIPTDLNNQILQEKARFYTKYFSVKPEAENHKLTVTMLDNTPENRRIIKRYLMGLGIRNVEVNKTNLTIDQFYEQYLK